MSERGRFRRSVSSNEHPIQFIVAEGQSNVFSINKEQLHELISQIPHNTPLSVISIVGAFRSGKSFLLNFFLRYLHALEGGQRISQGSVSSWMQFGGTILEGSLNSARRENGFSYGGGNQRVTEGIWLWSKPFIIPDPSTAGGKLCVLLMDTQGMWDGQTGQGLTTSIFGLSTLLSSYQIYNVQNRLQEDQLQHLAMFSEYSLKISEVKKWKEKAPFRHIDFLVRDFSAFSNEEDVESCLEEMKTYKREFLAPRDADDLNETRNKIRKCFEEIDVFCLPHPNREVTTLSFSGVIDSIYHPFLALLGYYVDHLFRNWIQPMEVNNRIVYAKDFESYALRYGELFAKQSSFPSVHSILQATAEVEISRTANDCYDMYSNMMDKSLDSVPFLTESAFSQTHENALKQALTVFDTNSIFGDKSRIRKYRDSLQSKIKEKRYRLEIRNWKRLISEQQKRWDEERQELKKQLNEKDAQASSMKVEMDRTIRAAASLSEEIQKKTDQINQLQVQFQQKNSEASTLLLESKHLHDEVSSLKSQLQVAVQDKTSNQEMLRKKEAENTALRKRVEEEAAHSRTLSEQQLKKENRIAELERKVREKEAEILSQQKEAESKKKRLNTLYEEGRKKDSLIGELNGKISVLQRREEESKDQLRSYVTQLSQQESKVHELNMEVRLKQKTITDLESQIRSMEVTEKTLRKQLAEREESQLKLSKRGDELAAQLGEKERQNSELRTRNYKLTEEGGKAKQKIELLTIQVQNRDNMISRLKTNYNSLLSQAQEKDRTIQRLETDKRTIEESQKLTESKVLERNAKISEMEKAIEVLKIDAKGEPLVIDSGSFNSVTKYVFSKNIETLEIADDCFINLSTFHIDGLRKLESIRIGMNSFTRVKSDDHWDWKKVNDSSRSFRILNCPRLKSIVIGEFSFSDYAKDFELSNLPELEVLKLGVMNKDSSNFYFASFVVRDLPSLKSIELGNWTFYCSFETVIQNLPSLETIRLGEHALEGKDDDRCSLVLQDLPKLSSISSIGSSFHYLRRVTLAGIIQGLYIVKELPKVEKVELPAAFEKVHTQKIQENVAQCLVDMIHPKSKETCFVCSHKK